MSNDYFVQIYKKILICIKVLKFIFFYIIIILYKYGLSGSFRFFHFFEKILNKIGKRSSYKWILKKMYKRITM